MTFETFIRSCRQKGDRIFCLVRRRWVHRSPEECVRQYALFLLLEMGYSRALIQVERKFGQSERYRRMDILAMKKVYVEEGKCDIIPYLLIEVKRREVRIKPQDMEQLLIYQRTLSAQYVSLYNGDKWFVYRPEKGGLGLYGHRPPPP